VLRRFFSASGGDLVKQLKVQSKNVNGVSIVLYLYMYVLGECEKYNYDIFLSDLD
jgi:hypothetical protein